MKATIIFGVILCVTVAVLSRRPEPTLQPYPVVFSASFNESGKCKLTLNWLDKLLILDLPVRSHHPLESTSHEQCLRGPFEQKSKHQLCFKIWSYGKLDIDFQTTRRWSDCRKFSCAIKSEFCFLQSYDSLRVKVTRCSASIQASRKFHKAACTRQARSCPWRRSQATGSRIIPY